MAKIIGIREQLGGWDSPLGRTGLFVLFGLGVAAALIATTPRPPLKPNRRRRRSKMHKNPELRVVVRSPLGERVAQYQVHAASLREAFDRAEDEAERLGVRVTGSSRAGNTYTIVGTTRRFAGKH